MSVDWFTLAAQVGNFVVLVWLLKRFLYGPIVRAMDERERAIAERIATAETRRREAERVREDYETRLARFEAEREARERQARAEAEQLRNRLMEDARAAVDAERRRWEEALAAERREHERTLRRRLAEGLCQVAREVLAGLAGRDLERQIVASFVERLRAGEVHGLAAIREALAQSHARVRIATAFQLGDDERQLLERAVQAALGRRVTLDFERRDELVCGLALATGAAAVEWSVDAYCRRLAELAGLAAEPALQSG